MPLKRIREFYPFKIRNKFSASFTLNELLITIAVLAILVGAVVIVLNPGELLAGARDSKRISELNSLAQAITLHSNSIPGGYKGEESTVYISLPDTSTTCSNLLSSLPSLPTGWSYNCVPEADLRKPDGSGWLPVNLSAISGGSPWNELPIDPENSATNNLYFAYVKSNAGYALAALLESEKQGIKAYEDGGSDLSRFEVGSDLSIWSTASGVVGYWPFNGSGNISDGQTGGLEDYSGGGNNGTASNTNGAGMSFIGGKVGSAIKLDGADDHVRCGTSPSLTPANISVIAWAKGDNFSSWHGIISNMTSWGTGFSLQMGPNQKIAAMVSGSYLTTSWAPQTGAWYHVVATHQASNNLNILYVNGKEENRNTQSISYEPGAKTYIGVFYTSPSLLFNGTIDEVMVYNRALSPYEVRAIYNATK